MVPGELVAADEAGLAPSFEHEVDVGAADPAVTDLDEHLAGTRTRHRPLLHRHLAGGAVDGHRHRLGDAGHCAHAHRRCPSARSSAPPGPGGCAPEPNMAAVAFTRFTYMCMSCSHV